MTDTTEGYVKYTARHQAASAFTPSDWAALNEARTTLHDAKLVGILPNGIGYGNVSIRTPLPHNNDAFLISGTATGAARVLTPNDYCLVKSFDLRTNCVETEGPIAASSESMSHGAIYRALPAVQCVIHIHSRVVFDSLLRENYPATPKDAAFGTPEMAQALFDCVHQNGTPSGIVVMSGHDEGVIVYGATIAETLRLTMDLWKRFSPRLQ